MSGKTVVGCTWRALALWSVVFNAATAADWPSPVANDVLPYPTSGLTHGPMLGRPASDSVRVWIRTDRHWDLWQGQTPDVPYLEERSHYTFRWWYEYSGGQMTDWGAHHLDIAQWAIDSLPVEIEGKAQYPTVNDGFNVAVDFHAKYRYANGVVMTVADTGRNGIMFTGDQGRLFVNRGTISGKPVEELKQQPLNRDDMEVYGFDNRDRPERAGKLDAIINHMGNFFDCIEARKSPISDVESQHRSVSTCHLGNIAMKEDRGLTWGPELEIFPEDEKANRWLAREQRSGFQIS